MNMEPNEKAHETEILGQQKTMWAHRVSYFAHRTIRMLDIYGQRKHYATIEWIKEADVVNILDW